LGGVSGVLWQFIQFDMADGIQTNNIPVGVTFSSCDFFGHNAYSFSATAAGGITLTAGRFLDLVQFRLVSTAFASVSHSLFATTNETETTNFLVSLAGGLDISGAMFNYTHLNIQRVSLAYILGLDIRNAQLLIFDDASVHARYLTVENDDNRGIFINDASLSVAGPGNSIVSTDTSVFLGAIVVRTNSKFTLNGDLTISVNGSSGPLFNCQDGELWLRGSVVPVGESLNLINAEECDLTMDALDMTADGSNDGAGERILVRNSDFDLTNSDISITNVTKGIHVFGGESFTLTNGAELTVRVNTGPAILVEDSTSFSAVDGTTVVAETLDTADPCVEVGIRSSIVLSGDATILANDSTCILIDTLSSFVQAATASTTLFCNVTEFTLTSKSEGVYTTGSTATLLPGTADKTMIGADLHNTSDLIASPGETFSDGTVGAGVQDCSLYVTPP